MSASPMLHQPEEWLLLLQLLRCAQFKILLLFRRSPIFLTFFGNPCLDIFFRLVKPDTALQQEANRNYLNQLLPMACSHNPLTTLKLVCNLIDRYTGTGKCDRESFRVAVSWLHQNHPKTLASNLAALAGEFSSFEAVLGILYQSLEGQVMEVIDPHSECKLTERLAKRALERIAEFCETSILDEAMPSPFI
ncbi:hypothetical protein D8674_012586 [Pyrus ussuriensis x Pyrus communis]|uniref:DUF2828 domain-containing protein n=1 Tax=Pyrus ussuriensis x Pyrus communis TaxID=2448454 RepID=A0A5N5G1Z4_9ROSA|nr:hypothetical protein D8674_012586 [Pyrus ussuriensis x Pyrus communis]